MESASCKPVAAAGIARDAHAPMAVGAEGLLLMAAHTAGIVLPCRLGMHRQKVVGMNLARAHTAIVAVGAKIFAMATAAESAVIGGYLLVALEPVGGVRGVVKPSGRLEIPRVERGF